MQVVLYSNDCPRCKILKSKLDEHQIEYRVVDDIDIMESKGFMMLPMLEIDGQVYNFGEAVKLVNDLR